MVLEELCHTVFEIKAQEKRQCGFTEKKSCKYQKPQNPYFVVAMHNNACTL